MEIKNVKVVHFVPGRVRLKVGELIKGEPELTGKIQIAFEAIPGVKRVEVKRLTGSVVIEYDTRAIQRAESKEALLKTLSDFFPTLDVSKLLWWLSRSSR